MMQVNYEKELSALAAEIINEEGATKEQAYICAAGLLDALLAYAREWDKSCVPAAAAVEQERYRREEEPCRP
jgi:hypothetical protein